MLLVYLFIFTIGRVIVLPSLVAISAYVSLSVSIPSCSCSFFIYLFSFFNFLKTKNKIPVFFIINLLSF